MPAYLSEEQPMPCNLEELAALDDSAPMEEPDEDDAGCAGEAEDELLDEDEELIAW
jgi:hypothetical protein